MATTIPEGGFRRVDGLKAWLDRQQKDERDLFSRVIAHRAAMRVFPASTRPFLVSPKYPDAPQALLIAVLRANLISRVGLEFPGRELSIAATSAAAMETRSDALAFSVSDLAMASAKAAEAAVTAHAISTAIVIASIRAVRSASDVVAELLQLPKDDGLAAVIDNDVEILVELGFEYLVHAPLWNNKRPDWWLSESNRMPKNLQVIGDRFDGTSSELSWRVWIDWYWARAEGGAPWGLTESSAITLETRIAFGDGRENFWFREAKEINDEIEGWVDAARAAQKLAVAQQESLGNHWRESGNFLEIGNEIAAGDLEVARSPVTQRAHKSLLRKAQKFGDAARGFDELYGWSGFGDDYNRLTTALECASESLAQHIWDIYDATLTFASYLQLDSDILGSSPAFSNAALSAAHRREFMDLVRSLAPWVRRFPTVQQEDENAANFLQRVSEQLTNSLLDSAHQQGVITDKDRELIKALLSAMERNGFPAEKAGIRAHFTVRNLVFAAAIVLSPFANGALEKSELYGKVTDWMAQRIDEITEIVADAPADIQVIIKEILSDIANREPGPGNDTDIPILPDGVSTRRRR